MPADGGFWQPITGTLESDESLEECIYRELDEEVSINKSEVAKLSDMFFSFTWPKGDTIISEYVFGVEIKEEHEVVLSDEHDDQRWCNFDEVIELLEKDNNKTAYKIFKDKFMVM